MSTLTRRVYPPMIEPCPVTELPFVQDRKIAPRKIQRSLWAVERTADYVAACDQGRVFAAHYLQFVKDGNASHGLLPLIVRHMVDAGAVGGDKIDGTHGYAVGFFSFIDSVLREALYELDPFELAQAEIDYHTASERVFQIDESLI